MFSNVNHFQTFKLSRVNLTVVLNTNYVRCKFKQENQSEVKWSVAKYGDPYSEFALCI